MADLQMGWSGDLSTSPTGDLAIVEGPPVGTERLLRRLMTNPGDYIWHPEYGAGLGRFVGRPVQPAEIEALVRLQTVAESAIAQTPEPVISIQPDPAGRLYLQIRYADAVTSTSASLTINVPG